MKRLPIILLLLLALGAGAWFYSHNKAGTELAAPGSGGRLSLTPLPALAEQFSGAKAYEHVKALTEIGPRPSASEGYEKGLVYLEAEFAKAGWTTMRQSFTRTPSRPGESAERQPVKFTNLLARHSATPDWTQSVPVVISGHVDSKLMPDIRFLGANDGGSSTGVIVELARVLATDPKAADQVELVLFDGEEALLGDITEFDGLYGSKYYATQVNRRSTWPAIGIVLDLIGDKNFPPRYNTDLQKNFHEALIPAAKDSGLAIVDYGGAMTDDHVPLQNIKMPVLHLIGNFSVNSGGMPYWHQAGDTLAVIDAGALEQTGRTVLRFLERVKN